ncbi:MAG TPA: prepilin-type N-terminal cleavage/methylation domain-containing protein [Pirellulaceae bacterium]
MKNASKKLRSIRRGFTLIELVVVVLILGILAAVALPKFVGQSDSAKLNGTLQSLTVLRTAIDTYRVNNSSFPSLANLNSTASNGTNGIMQYLRTQTFPAVTVGTNANTSTSNSIVAVAAAGTPPSAAVAGGAGWQYDATTGGIYINDASQPSGATQALYLY